MNLINILTLIAMLQTQPVGGPLTDALERRVDKLTERIEAWSQGSTVAIQRLEESQATRFGELLRSLSEARQERQTILDSIRELRGDREGVLAQIAEFRRDRDGILSRLGDVIADNERRWTPLQNLVDRLTALVWKILWFCVSVVIVCVVVGGILLFLYAKLASKVRKLVEGKVL